MGAIGERLEAAITIASSLDWKNIICRSGVVARFACGSAPDLRPPRPDSETG